MRDKEYYSIGEVSKICNISKKALRFYDEIGIISPDKICDDNNYRFYNRETLLSVPVIKYYKQMGFRLEEMKGFIEGNTYIVFGQHFRDKIAELKEMESSIYKKYTSVRDWYDLILEAQMVIENHVGEVGIKYLEASDYCYLDQDFSYNYMESIINIEFTNYIEHLNNEITGPVIINFPSLEDRMRGESNRIRILQKTILPCDKKNRVNFGGYMVASCYHIGAHETINSTYQKICDWCVTHGYQCDSQSYERYVTDYWTTRNKEQFVTEVIIKVRKD